jgi:superfamily II DNA or RNA helicase
MAGHKRIIVQSHVGSGKTVIAADIVQSAVTKTKRVLFIAPRRQLIYQTVETFKDFGINAGVIMAGEQGFSQPLVQVASLDTITARVKSGKLEFPDADLCIVDEAHMCMTPARLKVLENYPLVLGLTATPMLGNGKGMGIFYTDIVESLTMAQMVDDGHLVPMRYFIGDSPDLNGIKLNADGDYQEKALADLNDKPGLIGDIYQNWKNIAGDRTTLVFAVNRSHARHLHDEFESHGVHVDYVDGETPPEERERIRLDVESGKTQVVVNIGVMVAGVNWPRISCIVMARQTRNIATWIQCLGRGSRLYPGKSDTIVIYHGDNFDDLGRIDDPIEWSLDSTTTARERKQAAQKERKEPKDIKCKCGFVFRGSRRCPSCGYELIPKGEPIPVHQAELKEVTNTEKHKSEYKEMFYRQLLGYARRNNKRDGFAYYKYKEKFGVGPAWKKIAMEPGQDVVNYVASRNIAYAKSKS